MDSSSTLYIRWLKPDIEEERWEYFNHQAKQDWYRSHSLTWEQIVTHFESGSLVAYPRASTIGDIRIALSYFRYEDYQTYLAKGKRGYRKSYSQLETALQSKGTLSLKAPIILCCGDEGLLFSGYRRLSLGWNYGMVPYVWLVRT